MLHVLPISSSNWLPKYLVKYTSYEVPHYVVYLSTSSLLYILLSTLFNTAGINQELMHSIQFQSFLIFIFIFTFSSRNIITLINVVKWYMKKFNSWMFSSCEIWEIKFWLKQKDMGHDELSYYLRSTESTINDRVASWIHKFLLKKGSDFWRKWSFSFDLAQILLPEYDCLLKMTTGMCLFQNGIIFPLLFKWKVVPMLN